MNNKTLQHLLILLMSLLPPAYLLMVWHSVPDIVPTHFDIHNKPNAYSSKTGLLTILLVMSGVTLLVYFLMQYIHKIDPKQASKAKSPVVFNILGIGLAVFLTALSFVCCMMSIYQGKIAERSLIPLIGLLFTFLGAVMPKIQPNYFVGVRLPWTLSSDNNWHKTHELTGKLWFAGGIIFTILSFLLPEATGLYLIPAFIGVSVIIPIVYSFRLFKKEQANQNSSNS